MLKATIRAIVCRQLARLVETERTLGHAAWPGVLSQELRVGHRRWFSQDGDPTRSQSPSALLVFARFRQPQAKWVRFSQPVCAAKFPQRGRQAQIFTPSSLVSIRAPYLLRVAPGAGAPGSGASITLEKGNQNAAF